jgi:hypothetical protein
MTAYLILPETFLLDSPERALDLLSLCSEEGKQAAIIPDSCIPDSFLDLKTRLAGEILLKFTNYQFRAAAVISPGRIGNGKFREFMIETNRRDDFRVYSTRSQAEQWLISLPDRGW